MKSSNYTYLWYPRPDQIIIVILELSWLHQELLKNDTLKLDECFKSGISHFTDFYDVVNYYYCNLFLCKANVLVWNFTFLQKSLIFMMEKMCSFEIINKFYESMTQKNKLETRAELTNWKHSILFMTHLIFVSLSVSKWLFAFAMYGVLGINILSTDICLFTALIYIK